MLGLYGTSELPPPSLLEQHQSPVPSPIEAFTTAFPPTTTLTPPPFKPRGKKRQRGWEAVACQSNGVEAEGKASVEGRQVVQWVFREQHSEMAALAHNVHQAAHTHGNTHRRDSHDSKRETRFKHDLNSGWHVYERKRRDSTRLERSVCCCVCL